MMMTMTTSIHSAALFPNLSERMTSPFIQTPNHLSRLSRDGVQVRHSLNPSLGSLTNRMDLPAQTTKASMTMRAVG